MDINVQQQLTLSSDYQVLSLLAVIIKSAVIKSSSIRRAVVKNSDFRCPLFQQLFIKTTLYSNNSLSEPFFTRALVCQTFMFRLDDFCSRDPCLTPEVKSSRGYNDLKGRAQTHRSMPALKGSSVFMLAAPITVLKSDNIIFAKIAASLDFNELDRDLTGIFQ